MRKITNYLKCQWPPEQVRHYLLRVQGLWLKKTLPLMAITSQMHESAAHNVSKILQIGTGTQQTQFSKQEMPGMGIGMCWVGGILQLKTKTKLKYVC